MYVQLYVYTGNDFSRGSYVYGSPYIASISSTTIDSSDNLVEGDNNELVPGLNNILSVGEGNSLNTGVNTFTLSVNGDPRHTVSTDPLTVAIGPEGEPGSNLIDSSNTGIIGDDNTVVTGGNQIDRIKSGNTANTGDNNFNINVDEGTYAVGRKVYDTLGGSNTLNSVGNALGGLLGIRVSPNEGGNNGEVGNNDIIAGEHGIDGDRNTILAGSNTINTKHSDNTLNTGTNTLNLDFTGGNPSFNAMLGDATHTRGEDTIITSPNDINGEDNVVDTGDNEINNNNSGHTLTTNDNTVNIGGAFNFLRNKLG